MPWLSAHQLLEQDVDDAPDEEELERSAAAERADERAAASEAEWQARYASEVARLTRTRSRRPRTAGSTVRRPARGRRSDLAALQGVPAAQAPRVDHGASRL